MKPRFINLEEVIRFPGPIFAHTKNDSHTETHKETLQQHTKLCENYFVDICKARDLEKVFNRLTESFHISDTAVSRDLYFDMLFHVITFHDIGKINPEFQAGKMENKLPGTFRIVGLKGARHSLLSAVLYLNHFMGRIDQLDSVGIDRTQKDILRGFCLINGFVIAKHHSSMGEMEEFLNGFLENGPADSIMNGIRLGYEFLKDPAYERSIRYPDMWERFSRGWQQEEAVSVYTYTRFLYSVLVSCDYYATTEYGNNLCVNSYKYDPELLAFPEFYDDAELPQRIRAYGRSECNLQGINRLRSDIFLEADRRLKENLSDNLFFLEAPTGSGKSNIAMNLSFQLLREGYHKIFYIYPFNTLVEQNLVTLGEIFEKESLLFQKIVVLNSNTPIKCEERDEEEGRDDKYERALLDRQFLNYPFILSTHVSLFEIMFGDKREAAFGFAQLQDSIIVLDEIQSYKNSIWSEIIIFLKTFARLLNMKIIIMSATLPDLNYLTGDNSEVVTLIKNRELYFLDPLFRDRVRVSYELLGSKMSQEKLVDHIVQHDMEKNKIVVEMISKRSAFDFHELLINDERITVPIYYISGDDNRADREKKLRQIKDEHVGGFILVATQVIEAGVDIDMDIGYKDFSKLDSEEQFMGRINRSCKRSGIVYFFNMDEAKRIYKDGDYRINREFTLEAQEMQEILVNKNFAVYYQGVMQCLKKGLNASLNETENLRGFFLDKVANLNFPEIAKRMRLIEESSWDMSVYLARDIEVEGKIISGEEEWMNYKNLLYDKEMSYSEKQVRLSVVRSNMNYFIYQIKKTTAILHDEKIGELYYISNGEAYFRDGKLDKDTLEKGGSIFMDY